MSSIVLRNNEEATWDEQGCTPSRLTPEPTLHAHIRAHRGTSGDTCSDGRVTRYRVQA